MIPGKYNIVCPQGSTFKQQLTYRINDVPVNLTGYSARMQVRESYTSLAAVLQLITSDGIEVDDEGNINLFISAEDTSKTKAKEYVYDLELVSPDEEVSRIIEGKFIVTPEVTR